MSRKPSILQSLSSICQLCRAHQEGFAGSTVFPDYHDGGISRRSFQGSEKPFHLVMRSSDSSFRLRHGIYT
jgi:hypothetical protein